MLLIPDGAGAGEEERSPEVSRVRVGHHRRISSYSYQRLLEPALLSLSVLKLDGSVFDVQVARTAAVWELKAAIEDFFFPILKDERISVSWSHVWSHFCLCHKNQNLTDDRATLRSIGIRDGDQLRFAQHLSIDSLSKHKSKSRRRLKHRRSMASPEDLIQDERERITAETQLNRSNSFGGEFQNVYQILDENNEENSSDRDRIKTGMFFKGWFSYSRLKSSTSKNKRRG
ncbi:hypothetical protein LUZ60_017125 [Juncus effusus]|nr:hypothetical protein LUZ60_017125 [Juncus effusus]